jgi:hypothetical protein
MWFFVMFGNSLVIYTSLMCGAIGGATQKIFVVRGAIAGQIFKAFYVKYYL